MGIRGKCVWCEGKADRLWHTRCGPEAMCGPCAETRAIAALAELARHREKELRDQGREGS
jgi:hypothetical protein